MTKRKKTGVLISGNGSNLQALIDSCKKKTFPAEIAVVISNKADAYGLTRAQEAGIPTHVIDHRKYVSREAFDDAVIDTLRQYNIEIVCLAGFMRLLTPGFIKRWQGRLLNIHPSLLPSFKGIHSHAEAVASGVRFSGCTVHFVIPEMDAGPIIIQSAVPVLPDDTAETLGARVLAQEHLCYPLALRWLAEGKLSVKDGKVIVKGSMATSGALVNPAKLGFKKTSA